MMQSVVHFSKSAGVLYPAVVLYAKYGGSEEADTLINLGIRSAPDIGTKERFESLRANLSEIP
ncbi:hypothetical protein AW736_09460 [Termitidicoccus mucosus]|uniref:Uncharacterized protein n=2 Tax=Termitidicoccus mucosus TaxID=1184151 RepID=A0A178IKJ0_9BACT|nr:hypothetical protein AW736_09460 [Opitutaceae bacterium TSB47]